MKTVFHVGAHRTGTTTFQNWMQENAHTLAKSGLGFWGPTRTRSGLFSGITPQGGFGTAESQLSRVRRRIAMGRAQCAQNGLHTLLVSEENALGGPQDNVRKRALYPGAGERLARYHAAFDGRVSHVLLTIRALDFYWASIIGFCVGRGLPMPGAHSIDSIARTARSWRDVIIDMRCAMPDIPIRVMSFESYVGRSAAILMQGVDCVVPQAVPGGWRNKGLSERQLRVLLEERGDARLDRVGHSERRFMPFRPDQARLLSTRYAADLDWLKNGADGVATWIDAPAKPPAPAFLRHRVEVPKDRGRPKYGIEQGHMAQPG